MENNNINLLTYTGAYWEGKLYCLARDFNLLFSIDVQNGAIEPIDVIPEEEILINYPCGNINIWHDKLILTSLRRKKIWIYDLTSKQWSSFLLKECENCYGFGVFYQVHIYKNKIFCVGGGYPSILCLDIENDSYSYIDNPYKEMISRQPDLDYMYFWRSGVKLENFLYLASCHDNFVLKFDMDTWTYHWIKIGDDNYKYAGIAWDGNNFWLSPQVGSDIVKWNDKGKITIFPLPSKLKQHSNYMWNAFYDGRYIILPGDIYTPESIRIDPQTNVLEFYEERYPLHTRLENGMVIRQKTDGSLSITTEDTSMEYQITINTDQLQQFYKGKNLSVFKEQTLYHETPENPMLSLESFLSFTKSQAENNPSGGQIGKTIWDSIK